MDVSTESELSWALEPADVYFCSATSMFLSVQSAVAAGFSLRQIVEAGTGLRRLKPAATMLWAAGELSSDDNRRRLRQVVAGPVRAGWPRQRPGGIAPAVVRPAPPHRCAR
jgi:hypothetical protein